MRQKETTILEVEQFDKALEGKMEWKLNMYYTCKRMCVCDLGVLYLVGERLVRQISSVFTYTCMYSSGEGMKQGMNSCTHTQEHMHTCRCTHSVWTVLNRKRVTSCSMFWTDWTSFSVTGLCSLTMQFTSTLLIPPNGLCYSACNSDTVYVLWIIVIANWYLILFQL